MCCRYYIERNVPELADLFSAVSRSSLTSKFINTHSRPYVTHWHYEHNSVQYKVQKGVSDYGCSKLYSS